ncbi:MAG: hypothetical protein HY063_05565 [Bacteroidetes bacterium]|nr:hypothetical protein [Bacteroidota bacterium]
MRKSFSLSVFLLMVFSSVIFFTCRKDKGLLDYTPSGYPQEVGKILIAKCATQGCHNKQSKDVCAGLSLETWDDLFAGDRGGAVCIPYSHQYSPLFLFTNTDSTLSPVNKPTMPYNQPALSAEEQRTLMQWIDAGAPDAKGKIMWSDNPSRKKFYVTNQGCDVVTVFDAATLLQMRYIPVGSAVDAAPHMLKLSPDNKYWYVCFAAGGVLQKFRTSDDSKVGEAFITSGLWNTFAISNDSKYAYVTDWSANGRVTPVNLSNMAPLGSWSGIFDTPHGTAINSKGDTLYIGASQSNYIYKVPINDPGSEINISIDQPNPPFTVGPKPIQPHDIIWSPDSTLYFVSCDSAKSVRVLRRSDDVQIATIPTGDYPVEMSLSTHSSTPYLFVTCMKDAPTTQYPYNGSVTVINYQTLSFIKNIKGVNISDPHGIGVDDGTGLVYVANRNLSGPLPHHTTTCGGKIGFVSFIDLHTLELLPQKREIARDPYSIAVRH